MPDSSARSSTTELARRLVNIIRGYESAAVAFSGGVDSVVVARAAVEALGDRAVAVTAVSPSLAESERRIAQREAAAMNIRHVEVHTDEFDRDEYRANAGDRCFYCKQTLYRMIEQRLDQFNVRVMLNGTNRDDLGDHRPGLQAAQEHAVRSPLVEADLTKADVRRIARYWNLSVAEKPASPCLSSRIAYGVEVTPERVRRVEQAEAFLRQQLELSEFRVRLEAGDLARIEVHPDALPRFLQDEHRTAVSAELRRLGFSRVTIDLEGFRSGSLNDALPVVPLGLADKGS